MYGVKGADYNSTLHKNIGGNEIVGAPGGQGGYSKIRFTMRKDEEYVLTGLFSGVNAPFLYRKGTLIAVAGGGGAGGSYLVPTRGDGDGGAG